MSSLPTGDALPPTVNMQQLGLTMSVMESMSHDEDKSLASVTGRIGTFSISEASTHSEHLSGKKPESWDSDEHETESHALVESLQLVQVSNTAGIVPNTAEACGSAPTVKVAQEHATHSRNFNSLVQP